MAVLLAPLSALVGFVLLCGVGSRAKLRRYFYAYPRRVVHDEVLELEILRLSARRGWWLRGGQERAVALLLDVGSDEAVFIGGWPRAWNDAEALPARWMVWRGADDQRVLGIRAWGRRVPVRDIDGDVGCQNLEGKVLIRTVAELSAGLSKLLRPGGPYR